jgi:hypothetical protein
MHSQGAHPREVSISSQKNGKKFNGFTIEYIDRNKNAKADELMKATARNTPLPVDVFLQTISDALIKMI